jgi:hypothetical protein
VIGREQLRRQPADISLAVSDEYHAESRPNYGAMGAAENASFAPSFYTKTDLVTKTASGQTYDACIVNP